MRPSGRVEETSSPAVSARERALARTLTRVNEFAQAHPDEFAHLQQWAATGHRFSESLLWAIAKGETLTERQLAAVRRAILVNRQYRERMNGLA
jgi:hypothetical protein